MEARPGTPFETIEHGSGPPPPGEGRGPVGRADLVRRREAWRISSGLTSDGDAPRQTPSRPLGAGDERDATWHASSEWTCRATSASRSH
ncbi:hypothetical protein C0Z10_03210 [Acidipropionibacterium jensenii]|uniref:Uncharacterized protein n=1 Tax=Acidipropionibacterium jensenii TaxID=1749 RepID=A0A3Q9UN26_9ACTN|nr:hypothetical protein C0Z10_03210 [Acidipropionibacterium jensenii]AZZ42711.1 hypothetical protein C0Z11_10905 [Acidipropionibacterium jensenii]QCV88323.1 hypothetical protein FEZ32_08110 [Acidipropionibacterium jensenii]